MISANSGCLPSNATLDQIARVVVNIMQKNPQIMHLPFPMIVIAAFNAAWPCQAR